MFWYDLFDGSMWSLFQVLGPILIGIVCWMIYISKYMLTHVRPF